MWLSRLSLVSTSSQQCVGTHPWVILSPSTSKAAHAFSLRRKRWSLMPRLRVAQRLADSLQPKPDDCELSFVTSAGFATP